MREIKVKVYKLNELKEDVKWKVIFEHLDFLVNTAYINDTPEDIDARSKYTEDDAIESININEYEYFEDGELIPVDQYIN